MIYVVKINRCLRRSLTKDDYRINDRGTGYVDIEMQPGVSFLNEDMSIENHLNEEVKYLKEKNEVE